MNLFNNCLFISLLNAASPSPWGLPSTFQVHLGIAWVIQQPHRWCCWLLGSIFNETFSLILFGQSDWFCTGVSTRFSILISQQQAYRSAFNNARGISRASSSLIRGFRILIWSGVSSSCGITTMEQASCQTSQPTLNHSPASWLAFSLILLFLEQCVCVCGSLIHFILTRKTPWSSLRITQQIFLAEWGLKPGCLRS